MAFRAFIAVEVTPGQEALQAWERARNTGADLKLVDPRQTHITLQFLGDIDEAQVGSIGSAMDAATSGVGPFTVALKGLGVFPKPSYIKVLWMGMEGAEPLVDISKRLSEGLAPLGFRPDKPFSPHLTIARLRSGRKSKEVATLVESHGDTAFGEFTVDRIVLKKSVLTPKGPIYSDVRESPLKAGGP